jgi:hypothetical protein
VTERGGSPGSIQVGVLPASPFNFVQKLKKLLCTSALPVRPSRRIAHLVDELQTAPHRSSQLVKKVVQRALAVAAVQNLLMKKLGIARALKVEAADFECYVNMFRDGLFEEQVNLIKERCLFIRP